GCVIGHGVKMDDDCFLHSRVTVAERSVLGKRVILHSGVVIGSDGFGYEFVKGHYEKIPQTGYAQIDDDVEIGANTTVDRGRFGKTWIQEGVKIDNLVMIAHNVVVGKHTVIVAQTGLAGSVHCGAYVTIAGQVGTVGHIRIGDRATITGKVGVSKDCEAGQIYSGHRARPVREVMKIEALTQRLPELFDRVKELEKHPQNDSD
ncbi:MAG: UDP-3-O-(3-hydroxymyristoyl)glucosamine N-acyltransferase, partial [bacterium]